MSSDLIGVFQGRYGKVLYSVSRYEEKTQEFGLGTRC